MVYEEWETTWETVKRRGVEKEAVLPDPCPLPLPVPFEAPIF
jgi:hypothetical protein